MRIAVNLRRFKTGAIGGHESYVRHVLAGLRDEELTLLAQPGEFEELGRIAPGARLMPAGESGQSVRAGLRSGKFDVFFCPLHALEPLEPGIPAVVMTPDLQHEYYPQFFGQAELLWRRQFYPAGSQQANAILTPSEASKRTIVERYCVEPRRVVVTPLDVSDSFRGPASAVFLQGLPELYIYFPANFWPHKNHSRLFEALHNLARDDLHLVLTGEPGDGSRRVLADAERLGVAARAHYLGYQPEAVVAGLMRKARAVVFATLFEGFGIPVLEAMHAETPVVTARGGSTEELAGGAAVLVDPGDASSIAEGIRSAVEDEELRARLIQRGRERRERFRWSDTVAQTREVLRRAAGERAAPPPRLPCRRIPACRAFVLRFGENEAVDRTLRSLEKQSRPVEVSVVDDASPGGPARAFNQAARETREEVVCFLQEGDELYGGAVEAASNAFASIEGLAFVYGDTEERRLPPFERAVLLDGEPVNTRAVFYSREAFEVAGGFNSSLREAWEFDLRLRLSRRDPALHVPLPLTKAVASCRNSGFRWHWEAMWAVRAEFGKVPLAYLRRAGLDLAGRRWAPWAALAVGCLLNARRLPWFIAEWLRGWRENG